MIEDDSIALCIYFQGVPYLLYGHPSELFRQHYPHFTSNLVCLVFSLLIMICRFHLLCNIADNRICIHICCKVNRFDGVVIYCNSMVEEEDNCHGVDCLGAFSLRLVIAKFTDSLQCMEVYNLYNRLQPHLRPRSVRSHIP